MTVTVYFLKQHISVLKLKAFMKVVYAKSLRQN